MFNHHVAVWIDHKEARIFHVGKETFNEETVKAPHAHMHRHSHATKDHTHPADAQHFFHDVAKALETATDVLVLGPSTAKLELMKHLQKHDPKQAEKIIGIESSDHPTDGQLVAQVRKYFLAVDQRMG